MESLVPRSVNSIDQVAQWCGGLYKNTDTDLDSVNEGLLQTVYSLLDLGGKRWRPVYGMIIANDYGHDLRDLKANQTLYHLLAVGEVIHNASLIIDDIEDQSLKRRGQDCAYIKYGLDVAVNAGCWLYNIPISMLMSSLDKSDPLSFEFTHEVIKELTGLHVGQNWDICWHNDKKMPTEMDYFQMTTQKTGVIPRLLATLV